MRDVGEMTNAEARRTQDLASICNLLGVLAVQRLMRQLCAAWPDSISVSLTLVPADNSISCAQVVALRDAGLVMLEAIDRNSGEAVRLRDVALTHKGWVTARELFYEW